VDLLAQRAVEAHRDAARLVERAAARRAERDEVLRRLHAAGGWPYPRLARLVGLSEAAVAQIIRRRT
jgi:DNA-directed RNA polymerase specialized sigma24 family protein